MQNKMSPYLKIIIREGNWQKSKNLKRKIIYNFIEIDALLINNIQMTQNWNILITFFYTKSTKLIFQNQIH